ncbi:MAG TPA: response regulator [Polyangiaceae bacterium]|jgi:CheY-like chemotaxis protein|nr:response regulator [Polyangiaceae bacterium]
MKTILVVDDEFGIADTLSSVLIDEGYRVMVAMNGEQGLARMGEAKPDLVIVDFMMPVKSGPDMIRDMKASEELAGIPVVVMSAVSEAMVREECEFTAFLRKPFDLDSLLATVSRILRDG